MKNSELYLECLKLSTQTVSVRGYSYDATIKPIIEMMSEEPTSNIEKLEKALSILNGTSEVYTYPEIDGKIVQLRGNHFNYPIEKNPTADQIIERADKLFYAAMSKDK